MMISPESYIETLKNAKYEELIKQRDILIRHLREFEKKEMNGDRSGIEWSIHPSPEVRYQMCLEYLSHLSAYMEDRYNREYVFVEEEEEDEEEEGEGE